MRYAIIIIVLQFLDHETNFRNVKSKENFNSIAKIPLPLITVGGPVKQA